MKKLTIAISVICFAIMLEACTALAPAAVVQDAGIAKALYCSSINADVRAKVIVEIQKKIPGWQPVCDIKL